MKMLKRFAVFFLAAVCTLAFSVPSFAAVDDTGFADVDAGDWYADAVVYCRENSLMSGTGDNQFSPGVPMTRGMLATVLYHLAGSPSLDEENLGYPFADVPGDSWFANGVYWARLNGVAAGYDADTFGPNDPVTREQMVTMLWQYEGRPAAEPGADFADETEIAQWAVTAVDWARANGYISGVGGNRFDPAGTATRAQAARVLMGYHSATTEEPAPDPTPQPENDVLVAYFSATGNTENIAEHLTAILDADVYEILPEDPYTAEDLDYSNDDCRANREQNDPSARPAIQGGVENFADYQVIFLGYPIWWGRAPKIISTFLESYDFSGKAIIPFCTSGSSPITGSLAEIEALAPEATWLEGQRFSGSASQDTVEQWINSVGIELPSLEALSEQPGDFVPALEPAA